LRSPAFAFGELSFIGLFRWRQDSGQREKVGMPEHDGEERGLRWHLKGLSSLQQRFEESPVGEIAISVLVAVVIIVGVAWNLPESPIKRSLLPIVGPVAAATYVNQEWALFAPVVPTRTETVEVQVIMADGSVRVWTAAPGDRLTGAIALARWKRLMNFAIIKPEIRPGIARWVVRRVTRPSEHPVRVAMVLRVQNLPPPGEEGRTLGATAGKVLYQEDLTGPQ
jgi:hypothetical protein